MTEDPSGAAAPAAGTTESNPSAAAAAGQSAGGTPPPASAAEVPIEEAVHLDGPYAYWVGHPLAVHDDDVLNAYAQKGFLYVGKLHEWQDVTGEPQVLLYFESPTRKGEMLAQGMVAFQQAASGSGLLVPVGAQAPPGFNPAALRG